MMASVWPGQSPEESGRAARSDPGIGVCVLVPGLAQWRWGQRERGMTLMGSFIASAAIAGFVWGTTVGLALLAFAYVTHVFSASDAIRQRSFPAPSRVMTWAGTSALLGVTLYLPILTLAMLFAWPGANGRSGAERYLVNCWAYRTAGPQREDWVWYQSSGRSESRVGQVVAGQGQEVSWIGNVLQIDGRGVPEVTNPFRSPTPANEVYYRVPAGCVLIAPKAEILGNRMSEALTIVSLEQISGRAWARMYPIRERRLLLSCAPPRRPGES
jgi:hypothetical protein